MWKGLIVASALLIGHCRLQSTECHDLENHRRAIGEEWTTEDFIYRCELKPSDIGWRVFVAGCITPAGNRLMTNQSVIEDSNEFTCINTPGGGGYLKSSNRILSGSSAFSSTLQGEITTKCYDFDGKTKRIGEEWVSENFLFRCELKPGGWGWRIFVAGCITPGKRRIMVGQSAIEGSVKFTCVRTERNGGFLKQVPVLAPLS